LAATGCFELSPRSGSVTCASGDVAPSAPGVSETIGSTPRISSLALACVSSPHPFLLDLSSTGPDELVTAPMAQMQAYYLLEGTRNWSPRPADDAGCYRLFAVDFQTAQYFRSGLGKDQPAQCLRVIIFDFC